MSILLFGVVAAMETLNAPPQEPGPTPARPTVTPRPRPTSPRPTETAVPEPVLPAIAAPPPATQAPPPATPTPVAQTVMRVGNTDDEGVFIRRTPRMEDKIRPWQDGTSMAVLGPPQTVDGIVWLRVRAPDGVEGYVPAQYLVP